MSKTTLVTQQVQLQEWFQMMQESKGRPQQIPLDEWCKYRLKVPGTLRNQKKRVVCRTICQKNKS